MIYCICKNVNEEFLREAMDSGCKTFEDIKEFTGAATVCNTCEHYVKDFIKKYNEDKQNASKS